MTHKLRRFYRKCIGVLDTIIHKYSLRNSRFLCYFDKREVITIIHFDGILVLLVAAFIF